MPLWMEYPWGVTPDFKENLGGWFILLLGIVALIAVMTVIGFLIQHFGLDSGCGTRWLECDKEIPEGFLG